MVLDLYRLFMPYLPHFFSYKRDVKSVIGFSVEHSYALDRFVHYAWVDYMSNDGMTRNFDCYEVFSTTKPSSKIDRKSTRLNSSH